MIITWHMGTLPARIVIINQSGGTLGKVIIDTGQSRYEIGTIANGESRRVAVAPADQFRLTFHSSAIRVWSSPEPVVAGQSVVLYITPGDHVLARNRIGTLAR